MPPLKLPLGPRLASPIAKVAGVIAGGVVALAIVVAMMPWTTWVRAAVASALVALAGVLHRGLSRRRRPPAGWLTVDDEGVKRLGDRPLVDWRDPFGVTVLASADRSRIVLALTTTRATRFVAVRVLDAGDAAEAPSVFARALTVADADLRADDSAALCAADAERLLSALARRAPGSLDSVYLSDASGDPIVLERSELRIGTRRIDLSSPIEWRVFSFQELGTYAASVCQATWMRQGEGEVVLVAPMADGAAAMQAGVGDPPPRELRRAVDRIFMAPLRKALERAPRAARASVSVKSAGHRPSSP